MDFEFEINDLLPTAVSVVSLDVTCAALKIEELHPDETFKNWTHFLHCGNHNQTPEWKVQQANLKHVLNAVGKASSKAQGFSYTITNAEYVMERNHRVYILKDLSKHNKQVIIGFLKVGEKNLYLTDAQNVIIHKLTLCVLDFYVVENMQRKGYGHTLFSEMLHVENVNPGQLAIDFPSQKFLSFLKKHFSLDSPMYHPNRFVTFPYFFECLTGKCIEKQVTESSLQDDCAHEFIPFPDTNSSAMADTFKKLRIAESSWRTLGISPPHYGPEVCRKCGLENI